MISRAEHRPAIAKPNAKAATTRRGGFTLVELLVVITIILLITVATLPVVMPALNERRVSSAALLLQAELARARDTAVRANAPRGIRLLPETGQSNYAFVPATNPNYATSTPAYTRMIPIEPGLDHSEGLVRGYNALLGDLPQLVAYFGGALPIMDAAVQANWRTIWESKFTDSINGIPRSPTSWYWNVRRGDRIRIGNGRSWIIVGPMRIPQGPHNPEGYINLGMPGAYSPSTAVYPATPFPQFRSLPTTAEPGREFLIVMDGEDNDGDGFVDEAFDGIDNNDDSTPTIPVIDPGFDGIDNDGNGVADEPFEIMFANPMTLPAEIETESALNLGIRDEDAQPYTIERQPVPSQGARELSLPSGAAIDMTTWMANVPERSRLPVNVYSGHIDIMIAPNGQVVLPVGGRAVTPPPTHPFYHFWITDTDDIIAPDTTSTTVFLPLPAGTPGYIPTDPTRILRGQRRMVSLNTRSGQVTTTTLEAFDLSGLAPANRDLVLGRIYRSAEMGRKEAP